VSNYLILLMAAAFMVANLCGAWLTIIRLRTKQMQQAGVQPVGASRRSDSSAGISINFGFVRLETGAFGLFAVPAIIAIAFVALGVAVHQFW